MRSAFVSLAVVFLLAWLGSYPAAAQSSGEKSLHAFLAPAKGAKRTTTFSTDAPVIYAFWEGKGLDAGDAIQVIWIAEDIGDIGRKNTEIRRADFRIYKPEQVGAFSLSRPGAKVWPIGQYRVEIYINGGIAEVVKFTITPGVTIETH
ncbi:MAG TPA: hypothetical protein VLK27_03995 [Chthoniobacterales bacterium]|nr:hypothetical protein [Chthoniobacterales bacterium]